MTAALLLGLALAGGAPPAPGDTRGEIRALLTALDCGPDAAARWNEIEDRFDAWLPEACRLTPSPARCVAAAVGERVTLARALPALLPGCPRHGKDGAAAAWGALVLARRPIGADVRLQLARRLAALSAEPGAAELRDRIDAAWNGAIELAARQCGLLAARPSGAATQRGPEAGRAATSGPPHGGPRAGGAQLPSHPPFNLVFVGDLPGSSRGTNIPVSSRSGRTACAAGMEDYLFSLLLGGTSGGGA